MLGTPGLMFWFCKAQCKEGQGVRLSAGSSTWHLPCGIDVAETKNYNSSTTATNSPQYFAPGSRNPRRMRHVHNVCRAGTVGGGLLPAVCLVHLDLQLLLWPGPFFVGLGFAGFRQQGLARVLASLRLCLSTGITSEALKFDVVQRQQ